MEKSPIAPSSILFWQIPSSPSLAKSPHLVNGQVALKEKKKTERKP
jgi:hypothetical protein